MRNAQPLATADGLADRAPAAERAGPAAGALAVPEPALRAEVERLRTELAQAEARADRLEALAHEDPLTGLLNRRGFERDLARALAYCRRYGTPAALLLADLDRFKPVNDVYGHGAGDEALRHVAALLRRHTRGSDSVARLGGDEFGLILWQVDAALAGAKAASLSALVTAAPLRWPRGPDGGLQLSLSIGVSLLMPDDAPDAALGRADAAMYGAKARRGRIEGA